MKTSLVVLVADEESAIRDLLKDYLSELDLRVILAANAAEVLRAVREHRVDIVLIDLHLPGTDAPTLFAEAVKLRPDLRQRFIFTGPIAGAKSRTEFGSMLLAKPFRFEDLGNAILALCDRAANKRSQSGGQASQG